MLYQPKQPIPAPLRGTDPRSFAEDTIIRRMPDIARRILAENEFDAQTIANIKALIEEIPNGKIRPLTDQHAPDFINWNEAIAPHTTQNWLETSWFLAETYFYRRIIEAADFFRTQYDPFAHQKNAGLNTTLPQIEILCKQEARLQKEGWQQDGFTQLLMADLWGNQVDLSLWAAESEDKPNHENDDAQRAHTIIDDTAAVFHLLDQAKNATIHFIIDNAAFELITDLLLADYLLTVDKAITINFHLKLHPTFVSDATIADIKQTIDFLTAQTDHAVYGLGERLRVYLQNGRFQFSTHPFWTSPHPMWFIPDDLRQTLADATLIISKGDANYRRCLGDAHWPYTTPFNEVVRYMPAPFLALRTCKSNVIVGIKAGEEEKLNDRDPDWIINGKWGLVQYVKNNRQ